MALGLIGRKIGMTRVFTDQGESRAVTVVEAGPNRVTQVKTAHTDGYHALQVTVGERRASRVSKAMQGHFAKAGVEPGRKVREFRLEQAADPSDAAPGSDLTVEMFSQGQKVDVTGRTIGKGFAGVMKRHGFRGGRATHGNSKAHRLSGATGNAQDPGRIFKGKKMAGQMGGVRRVQQGLEVVRVDAERNLLLISGSVPGARGADVIIRPSVKAKKAKDTHHG
ncbi:MAG: 50S ribosomal protein L3 [Gammaproteobacteria bacterium]|nr:50S ribosomal protein L3 [Gammaproteobacteria bacterium]